MFLPHTRSIFLSPLSDLDIPLVYEWRNSSTFRSLCSVRRESITLEEFRRELADDFERDRHEQYLIIRRRDARPVGTLYSYNLNRYDGHCFVTIFVEPTYAKQGFGPQAFLVYVVHLFESLELFKIYTDVYDYNFSSLQILQKAGFQEEGRFLGHRLVEQQRYDLIRMAICADQLPRAQVLLKKWGGENVE